MICCFRVWGVGRESGVSYVMLHKAHEGGGWQKGNQDEL